MSRPSQPILVWAVQDITLPQLGGPNKVLPINDLQQKGWDMGQRPAADEFNYILNNFSEWIAYLDEKTGGTIPSDFAIDSVPNTQAKRDSTGLSCFTSVRGSLDSTSAWFALNESVGGYSSVGIYSGSFSLGKFVRNNLVTTNDNRQGLQADTAGTHYGASIGTHTGDCVGNASTATTWKTSRSFTIGNTTRSVNGSGNVAWSLADLGAASTSHVHNRLTANLTTLWAGDLDTGNFTLSEAYTNYDALIFIGTRDSGDIASSLSFYTAELEALDLLGIDYQVVTLSTDGTGYGWWGVFDTDKRTFITSVQNTRLRAVHGIRYTAV